MKKTILIGLVSLFINAYSFAQSTEEKAIKKTIIAFTKAGDKNDVKDLKQYLDTNYRVVMNQLFGSKNVSIISKYEYLEKIRTKEWGGDNRELKFKNIMINGSVATALVTFKGSKITFVSLINLVKNVEGKWLLISDTPVIL